MPGGSGILRLVGLHARGCLGELIIADRIAEPARVIALAQMKKPRAVIHTFSELQEQGQILCTQIERARAARGR